MSAYIVTDRTINALATAYLLTVSRSTPSQTIAQTLLDENYRSVNFRYKSNDATPSIKYRTEGLDLSAVEVLALCSGYEYQACETNDWSDSKACKMIEAIKYSAICRLPGFEEAPRDLTESWAT